MKSAIMLVSIYALLVLFYFEATHHHQAQTLPWLLSLLLLSIFYLSLKFWFVPGGFAWRNHQKLQGPIGWPLLGHLSTHMGSLAHRKFAALASSYGATRLMALSLGSTRLIISSHPETAKEILSKPAFSDRPTKESARLLLFDRAIGFAPSGEYWRHLRRIAATHMFSPKRISSLEPLRSRLADRMLVGVEHEMMTRGVVRVRGVLQEASLKNVIGSVFGMLSREKEELLGGMVREGYEVIGRFNMEDYFGFRWLDFYGVRRRCGELGARVKALVGGIVEERKEFRGKHNDDFLSVLLSLPEEEQLCDSDMIAVLWEMIFRGTDTVGVLLEWIMARMVLHQDIQAKAQEEIDTCVQKGRHVQDSDIPKLPFLQSIVKEVLRMHPPGPLLSWARLAVHDVHVGKSFIPAGTTAMINMWAITHDSSIWKDPWTFRPERFMEEEVAIMGSDLRLAPFGSGRRVCPGKALGLSTVHLWLARLLHQFKWIPAQPVDLSELLRLSLEMKKPLSCHAILRKV